jgi:hypothetical protein
MISKLLSNVIQQAQTLPIAIQDELAEQFLEDIENEIKWQETLSKPQESLVLEEIARKALQDLQEGRTKAMGFDEL